MRGGRAFSGTCPSLRCSGPGSRGCRSDDDGVGQQSPARWTSAMEEQGCTSSALLDQLSRSNIYYRYCGWWGCCGGEVRRWRTTVVVRDAPVRWWTLVSDVGFLPSQGCRWYVWIVQWGKVTRKSLFRLMAIGRWFPIKGTRWEIRAPFLAVRWNFSRCTRPNIPAGLIIILQC